MRSAAATPGASEAKTGVEPRDGVRLAADHQAVAALGAPDPAARADVDVVDAPLAQACRVAEVVGVVGVAAVDDRVAGLEHLGERGDRGLRDPPAGTITQTARGAGSRATRSANESAPIAPSAASTPQRRG